MYSGTHHFLDFLWKCDASTDFGRSEFPADKNRVGRSFFVVNQGLHYFRNTPVSSLLDYNFKKKKKLLLNP